MTSSEPLDNTDPWDEVAPEWDQNPAVRAYADAAFTSLEEILAGLGIQLDGASCLDFGCGTGLLTERLVAAGAGVVAVDTSPAMLDIVRAKASERGWVGVNASTDPPRSARLDLIACSSVCGFLEDYPATASRLTGLLRPGGLFVQWDWERDPDDESDHGLDRESIREALNAAGLEQITVREAFTVTVEDQSMRPLVGFGITPV
jgi:2-polyprenyl-3-methyl-5-hydroxy-6-metoxy-1,4-benzoquinol methylase